MSKTMKWWACVILVLCITSPGLRAQGAWFGIMGGPTLSNQSINGFQKEPFLRYHIITFVESCSEINPNAMYARLGYHIKGSAVNTYAYYDPVYGTYQPSSSYSMEFHNLSLSVGFKQRRELGTIFYHYGFGLRGDYNLKTEYGPLFAGLEGTENKFTYGVNVDAGIEFPLGELVSAVIEFGFSPDLSNQIYIPYQDTGYNYDNGAPVILPETNLKNLVFEARAGFRFWHKVIYTD